MNCVRCGRRAGYNRAVVDVTSGVLLGGFCVDCEESAFGESLQQGLWRGADGCGLCPRDGHVALPRWTASAEERDGDLHSTVDYRVTDGTLLVCDEHLALVRGGDAPDPERRGAVRP